jgi:hypothetical protein
MNNHQKSVSNKSGQAQRQAEIGIGPQLPISARICPLGGWGAPDRPPSPRLQRAEEVGAPKATRWDIAPYLWIDPEFPAEGFETHYDAY